MGSKRVETPAAQLSLELDASVPRLPATLRPMLPRTATEPFDSSRHLFEPAWGGRRALAFVEAAVDEDGEGGWRTAEGRPSVRLLDADGIPLLDHLAELRSLALRLEARSAILDGELVAVDASGHSDIRQLRARLGGRGDAPVALLVFDLPYLDGRPLIALPLTRRRQLLAQVLRPGPEVVTVPAIETDGIALHEAVVAQRLAGTRARVASSPYLPGVRSALWRSIRAGAAGPARRAGEEAGDAAGGTDEAVSAPAIPSLGAASVPGGALAPVLAVMRRLPLEDAEPEPG
ncbi:MAG TPA: hypothetical protein VEY67_10630 [Candidatus Dormibacteraeota bacterium]|nr:hypothetical protein [Candidatus Dormibacteraeota bacterium]